MLKQDSITRDLISEAIRSVVDGLVKEHYDALTQEHQLSSRICQELESRLKNTYFGPYRVKVIAQEMPDKGPNTLEKKTGADIYIGVQVEDVATVSKGLFIQAKWKEGGRSAREQQELVKQCENLRARTRASYLWLYGPNGVEIVPASEVADHPYTPPENLGSRRVNELFQQVLDCYEGDIAFGIPTQVPVRKALGAMLKEFGAKAGAVINIKSTAPDEFGGKSSNPLDR